MLKKKNSSPAGPIKSARLVHYGPDNCQSAVLIPGKLEKPDSGASLRFRGSEHRSKRRKIRRSYRHSAELNGNSILRLTRRFSKKIKSIPGNISVPLLRDLEQTWPHFLEEYSKMNTDLSLIDRPMCFNGYGFMSPPLAQNENRRNVITKTFLDKIEWNHHKFFEDLIRPILQRYNLAGASVSLLDRTRQIVKHSVGLSMKVISRSVSIDGHALLSTPSFILLDASCDWRMVYNPLVHGPPFIHFYAGVALKTSAHNLPIGVFSVFDQYVRSKVPDDLIAAMTHAARTMMRYMEVTKLPSASFRIESASEDGMGNGDLTRSIFRMDQPGESGFQTSQPAQKDDVLLPHECTVRYNPDSLQRLTCTPTLLKTYEISRELMDCDDAKDLSTRACHILAQVLGLDFVYILEIRVTALHRVSKRNIQFPSGIHAATVPDIATILGPEKDRHVRTRLFGGYGLQLGKEYQFDSEVHVLALGSSFGVQYNAPSKSVPYQAGIFMPFCKSDAEIIYSFGQSTNDHEKDEPEPAEPVIKDQTNTPHAWADKSCEDVTNLEKDFDAKAAISETKRTRSKNSLLVKSKYGGFVMAGLNSIHRNYSPGDVEYMKLCVKALDNILSCSRADDYDNEKHVNDD